MMFCESLSPVPRHVLSTGFLHKIESPAGFQINPIDPRRLGPIAIASEFLIFPSVLVIIYSFFVFLLEPFFIMNAVSSDKLNNWQNRSTASR